MELQNEWNTRTRNAGRNDRSNVQRLQTDGGGEYSKSSFSNWLQDNGAIHGIATTSSPETNGSAERLNRTVLDMARTMLKDSSKIGQRM